MNAGTSSAQRIALQWTAYGNSDPGNMMLTYGSPTFAQIDRFESAGRMRDPSAWYHFVIQFDSTQATSADRLRFYVNAQERTLTRTNGNDVPQNDPFWFTDNGTLAAIGCSFHNGAGSPSSFFEGYAAEIHTIDGQALEPTDFGEFDNNGVWIPTEYAGTYGTSGFHLTSLILLTSVQTAATMAMTSHRMGLS